MSALAPARPASTHRAYGVESSRPHLAWARRRHLVVCHIWFRAQLHVTRASSSGLRVMIAGPPAAGKGTQCARIVEKYGLVHVSAGDLLRAEVAAGSPSGRRVRACMDAGELVPAEVVVDMVFRRLEAPEVRERGWLLDGYPRSAEQAAAVAALGVEPDVFVLLRVPDARLVERIAGRRLDPATGEIYHLVHRPPLPEARNRMQQRSDDTAEAMQTRLATYHSSTRAVIKSYADVLVEVDGDRPMDDVFRAVCSALDVALEVKERRERRAAEVHEYT